jgi:glycosyltransferase involved in cell wall biosynthesis
MSRAPGMRPQSVPDLRFAVPGDIETRTGGYIYDRRLMLELRGLGWAIQHLTWRSSFPFPDPADLSAAARSLAAQPDGSLILIDGLAFGAMPDLAEGESRRLRLVGLVHHPLAYETGLTPARHAMLLASERRALQAARAVICTGATTARTLTDNYGIAADCVFIARPGTDPASLGRAPARATDDVVHLLSVGTVTHRKGHDLLVAALALVADLRWTCTIVGSLDRAPGTVATVREMIARQGLGDRIVLAGEVADLSDLYARADIFALASRYEGYGMAFAEALQHGLPVIATTGGAIPEVVPPSAGILVPPDNVAAMALALRRLIADPAARRGFAAGAREAAKALPRWEETARRVAAALQGIGS